MSRTGPIDRLMVDRVPVRHRSVSAVRAGLLLWAVAYCLLPALARAEAFESPLAPGTRVRVNHPSLGERAFVGRVIALSGDTLTFAFEAENNLPMRVLLDHRCQVDSSVAHHNRLGRGLLIGGAVGGLIGGTIVAGRQFSNDVGESIGGVFGAPPQHHTVSSTPFYIGLGAGCALGAIIGASVTVDTWAPVHGPTRMSFGGSFGDDGRLQLAVSLPF